jgi:hypothetical protein
MMDKFLFWFTENRKKIGYTLGVTNILSGIMCLNGYGQYSTGLIQIFVGTFVIFDAWLML